MFAIAYTRPGTTLTFWLNKFSWGGFIWSLVRSRDVPGHQREEQEWNQPALRFPTEANAQAFIDTTLGGNPLARIVRVEI